MSNRTRCRLALLCLTVLAGCGGGEETPAPAHDEARIAAARKIAEGFADGMRRKLGAALVEAGGIEAAIGECRTAAPALAAAAAKDGYTVRRIGTRVRNAANTPTAAERAILGRLDQLPPDELRTTSIEGGDSGHWALYVPIVLAQPLCLRCHGPVEDIAPEVRAKLAELYPDDAATGYAIGDLRGAFVVEAAR